MECHFFGKFGLLLLIIPIASAMLGVIISFGAVCVSGMAISLSGLLGIFALPFIGIESIFAGLGICIATIGVGLLIFVTFYYLTKYTAIITFKCLKAIYTRSKL